MKWKALTLAVALLAIGGLFLATGQLAHTADEKPADVLTKADKLFEDKNYKEAAEAFLHRLGDDTPKP